MLCLAAMEVCHGLPICQFFPFFSNTLPSFRSDHADYTSQVGDLESSQAPLILDINGEAGFCVDRSHQIALETRCSFC